MDFKVRDKVFYTDYLNKKIKPLTIQFIDIVDEIPRYWPLGYFGYVHKNVLFKTHQEAKDRIDDYINLEDKDK